MIKKTLLVLNLFIFLNACSSASGPAETGGTDTPNLSTPSLTDLNSPQTVAQNPASGPSPLDNQPANSPAATLDVPVQLQREAIAVNLNVIEKKGVNRNDEPIAQGVPFTKGAVKDPSLLTVYDEQGNPLPTQAHQLGLSWPDGSLKWALVQFKGSAIANKKTVYTLRSEEAPPAPASPLNITETPNSLLVKTGPLQFELRKHSEDPATPGNFLPSKIWVNDSGDFQMKDLVLKDGANIKLIADHEHMTAAEMQASGKDAALLNTFGLNDKGGIWKDRIRSNVDFSSSFACPCKIEVEENGPLRAVFRISPEQIKNEGDLGFIARIYAYAGKKYLKVELMLDNYDDMLAGGRGADGYVRTIANAKHIRNFVVSLKPRLGTVQQVEQGLENNSSSPQRGTSKIYQVDQDTLQINGQSQSGKAPGWMAVNGENHSLFLATQYFWEVAPKAIEYEATSGEARFHFWPAESSQGYPLTAGRQKAYEFLIGFDSENLNADAAAINYTLLAYPDPKYVSSTAALNKFITREDPAFPSFNVFRANSLNRYTKKQRLWGDIGFGDQISWGGDPTQSWNDFHGVSHELWMDFFASGDPELYRMAEASARHVLDVDTVHHGEFAGAKENINGNLYSHVSNGAVLGSMYNWRMSDADFYFMTGKRRILEAIEKTVHFLTTTGGTGKGGSVASRATTTPLMHLGYLYQVSGSEKVVKEFFPNAFTVNEFSHRKDTIDVLKARVWFERMKEMVDFLPPTFDLTQPYEDGRHYRRSAMMVGYATEGCYRFWNITQYPVAADCVTASTNYIYNAYALPSGIPMDTGGAPWDEFNRWAPGLGETELAPVRAYEVTKDLKYLDYAKGPLDWMMNYSKIATNPNGFSSGVPKALGIMAEAGLKESDLTKMRKDIDYKQALKSMKDFLANKLEAKPEEGKGAYCKAASEVARVHINRREYDEAINYLDQWLRSTDNCRWSNSDNLSLDFFKGRAQALKNGTAMPSTSRWPY